MNPHSEHLYSYNGIFYPENLMGIITEKKPNSKFE